MFDNWEVDNTEINPPIDSNRIKIDLIYKDGTLAETQPVLSFNKLVFSNKGLQTILKAKKKYGPYKQIPIKYRFSNRELFDGYLTDFNYLLEVDEIEAKPVSLDSTDGLTELLSSMEMSLLKDDFVYRDIDFLIEKVDVRGDLVQLGLSILFYSYLLYSQIKETARLIARGIEATGNAAGLSFGTALALVIELVIQAIFLAVTVIQLIKYAIRTKELVIPRLRKSKGISFHELIRVSLERIGYSFETEFSELHSLIHWASGNVVKNNEYYPRSKDRCGNAISLFNFIIDKFAAKIAVRDRTVYLYSPYSDFFLSKNGYVLEDFPRGNYKENLSDQKGTREILYAVDYQDQWTLENFKGTEYKIRANISDPKKSTILGIDQSDYGIALGNDKTELNPVEKLWKQFASLVNTVSSIFGGGSQALSFPSRIGVVKISSEELSVAKILYMSGRKLPSNHRELLSAKSDEEKYHWIKSHVRNPRARKRVYENIPMKYTDNSLSCNLDSNEVLSIDGIGGELKKVSWEMQYDEALVTFELEDVNRDPQLIETFEEPEK